MYKVKRKRSNFQEYVNTIKKPVAKVASITMICAIKLTCDIALPQSKQLFLKQLHHSSGNTVFPVFFTKSWYRIVKRVEGQINEIDETKYSVQPDLRETIWIQFVYWYFQITNYCKNKVHITVQ